MPRTPRRSARPAGRMGQQHRHPSGAPGDPGRQGHADRRGAGAGSRNATRASSPAARATPRSPTASSWRPSATRSRSRRATRPPATTTSSGWSTGTSPTNRTSLVVDPPNGRLPPLTSDAQRLVDDRAAHLADNPASSWTDRRLQERCITFGMPNLFAGYNSYYQIIQTPRSRRIPARDDPRRAHRSPRRPAARRRRHPAVARRRAGLLGRRHAGGGDAQLLAPRPIPRPPSTPGSEARRSSCASSSASRASAPTPCATSSRSRIRAPTRRRGRR